MAITAKKKTAWTAVIIYDMRVREAHAEAKTTCAVSYNDEKIVGYWEDREGKRHRMTVKW